MASNPLQDLLYLTSIFATVAVAISILRPQLQEHRVINESEGSDRKEQYGFRDSEVAIVDIKLQLWESQRENGRLKDKLEQLIKERQTMEEQLKLERAKVEEVSKKVC